MYNIRRFSRIWRIDVANHHEVLTKPLYSNRRRFIKELHNHIDILKKKKKILTVRIRLKKKLYGYQTSNQIILYIVKVLSNTNSSFKKNTYFNFPHFFGHIGSQLRGFFILLSKTLDTDWQNTHIFNQLISKHIIYQSSSLCKIGKHA